MWGIHTGVAGTRGGATRCRGSGWGEGGWTAYLATRVIRLIYGWCGGAATGVIYQAVIAYFIHRMMCVHITIAGMLSQLIFFAFWLLSNISFIASHCGFILVNNSILVTRVSCKQIVLLDQLMVGTHFKI